MKAEVLCSILLVLAAGGVLTAAAQITITSADATAMFASGKVSWTYDDSTTSALDIGSTGLSSWDFRSLKVDFASTLTGVAPASTPYASTFPGATHAFQTSQSMEGITLTMYQYFILSSTSVLDPGLKGGAPSQFGDIVYTQTNTPAAVIYSLPSTFGSTWNTSYVETFGITAGGFPIVGPVVTSYAESYHVDAYGPMTVPGGATYQALRIRYEERSPGLSVGYIFMAKEGAIITVMAGDTLSSSSGVIPVAGVSWISPTAVGVAAEQTAPADYALLQNFPNPFNPATEIRYVVAGGGTSGSGASPVRIEVYDLLGREVAVLVDESKTPGAYSVSFDAKGLSSGVYLYRLTAGNFGQTRRMLLVR